MACTSGQPQGVTLEATLSAGSDVLLAFKEEIVPAHSVTLRQWSGVLGSLLDGCGNSGSNSDAADNSTGACAEPGYQTTATTITIPMEGTSKQDWLTAMSFVYPVVPQPRVSWDNVEVLLTVANKYNMPALLSRAGMFLQDNTQQLTSSPGSLHFAWKWITLADKAGLPDVAQACITSCFSGSQAAAVVDACKKEVLVGMSPATCCHLLEALAQQRSAQQRMMQPGVAYCCNCKCFQQMRAGHQQTYGSIAPAMLRCLVCQKGTVFNTA